MLPDAQCTAGQMIARALLEILSSDEAVRLAYRPADVARKTALPLAEVHATLRAWGFLGGDEDQIFWDCSRPEELHDMLALLAGPDQRQCE